MKNQTIKLKMWKTITKARNKKTIIVYYAVAIIFASIGLYTEQSSWYIYATIIFGLALIRKYRLMKKLKE